MKLKNKKTGEIIIPSDYTFATYDDGIRYGRHTYYSLAELNEEWEDYEEPKEYWYIDPMVCGVYFTKIKNDEDLCEFNKQIGNYFETKEEAEKVVEKLKAWKRLKDKGFRFYGYNFHDILSGVINIKAEFENSSDTQIAKDLDLLFGGEE